MASADSTVTRNVVYLISGANRGIGFALTKTLSQRPNHVIYAGTRSPPAKNNDALRQLADETSRSVRIVQLSSGSSLDEAALVQQIKAEEGHIDALIANAGIANHEAQAKTKDASFDHVMDHFRVNTLGPWSLYKSIYPLLKEAPRGAKFITISSRLGSLGAIKDLPVPAVTYSISKASVNFLMLKTHSETEDEGFVVFPMCPGWTQTEMGNAGAVANGMEIAPVPLQDAITGMVAIIDAATRKTHGGRFWGQEGVELPL